MKNLLLIFLFTAFVNVLGQTGIDTLIVKDRDWKIIGEILVYDDNTVTFRPIGFSKIRTINITSLKEIRFHDGSVQCFVKNEFKENLKQNDSFKQSKRDSVNAKPDSSKKENLFVTDIFDDFMLLLSNGEPVKLHGLKQIDLMDSKKPPEYIRNQTYLYIVENLGGRLIELEYIDEEAPIKEVIIYSDGENFNEKAIRDGYARPQKGSIFYEDDYLIAAEKARKNARGIWGKEGIDLIELTREVVDNIQTDSEQSESSSLNANNPFMDLFQNIAGKLFTTSKKMEGAPGEGVVNQYTQSLKILGLDSVKNLPQSTLKDIMKKHNLEYPEETQKKENK